LKGLGSNILPLALPLLFSLGYAACHQTVAIFSSGLLPGHDHCVFDISGNEKTNVDDKEKQDFVRRSTND